MKNFPKQQLSFKEKIKDEYKWARNCIDALLIDYTKDASYSTGHNTEYERKLSNYQLFNNIINQKDLERECNPLGLEVGQFKDEIQPYNKTYNKIQTLLEEENRMPFKHKVVLTNEEGIRSKIGTRDVLFRNYIYSKMDAVLNEMGMSLPEGTYDPEQVMDPKEVDKYMSTNYLSAKEITGSKLLQYLVKYLSIRELKNDAYKHALLSGEEFAYVGIRQTEPYVEVLNPLGVFYQKSGETKYIQDGLYAGYRTYLTTGDVMDIYGQYMSDEDRTKVDKNYQFGFAFTENHTNEDMKYYHYHQYYDKVIQYTPSSYNGDEQTINTWLVQHVEWKSQKRVGFLTYLNEYGDEEMDIVSEDFEIPSNATSDKIRKSNRNVPVKKWIDPVTQIEFTLEWTWIPEVWEGVRIGQDIYCNLGPKEYQFRSLENPYKVQLGYHGLIYNAMNSRPVSLMDRMKPFQYLYFIIMHKIKKFIAQDKGKIFQFDVSMVDPKIGLEKTLYYLTNLNINFINPLMNTDQPGWSQRSTITQETDMSSSQTVLNYVNLLAAIDQQISDVAGVSRGREGQISPNEAVTNAQSNNQYSAVVTGPYFQAHNNNWNKILSSLLDVAQAVYKDKTVVKQWLLDDMSVATLELTPDSLTNASFGVFISDSVKDEQIFETLKGLMQALVQNDKASFSDLIHALKSDSIAELSVDVRKAEEDARKSMQQAQQAQMEMQAKMQADERAFELEKEQMANETKIRVAEITSFRGLMDNDSNNDGIPDQLEIDEFKQKLRLEEKKLDIEAEKVKAAISKSNKK